MRPPGFAARLATPRQQLARWRHHDRLFHGSLARGGRRRVHVKPPGGAERFQNPPRHLPLVNPTGRPAARRRTTRTNRFLAIWNEVLDAVQLVQRAPHTRAICPFYTL